MTAASTDLQVTIAFIPQEVDTANLHQGCLSHHVPCLQALQPFLMLASTGVPQGKDQDSRGERAKYMSSDFCEVVRTVQQVGVSQRHQTVRHQGVRFFRTVQQWGQPCTTKWYTSGGLCSSWRHPWAPSLRWEAAHIPFCGCILPPYR